MGVSSSTANIRKGKSTVQNVAISLNSKITIAKSYFNGGKITVMVDTSPDVTSLFEFDHGAKANEIASYAMMNVKKYFAAEETIYVCARGFTFDKNTYTEKTLDDLERDLIENVGYMISCSLFYIWNSS